METMEKYLSGLTEAEMDDAEKIEAELNAAVGAGFTEKTAEAFVSAVPVIRKYSPTATVPGIFDMALRQGLVALVSQLSGVQVQPGSQSTARRITKKSSGRLVR